MKWRAELICKLGIIIISTDDWRAPRRALAIYLPDFNLINPESATCRSAFDQTAFLGSSHNSIALKQADMFASAVRVPRSE